MMSSLILQLNIHEFCQSAELPQAALLEIIEHGILEPSGATPEQWLFDANALVIAKRARRLQGELQIEWAGIALALQLLDELEQLRTENSQLRRRLSRFETEYLAPHSAYSRSNGAGLRCGKTQLCGDWQNSTSVRYAPLTPTTRALLRSSACFIVRLAPALCTSAPSRLAA